MKNYFSFGMSSLCGIPSITLMGKQEDWENLRCRTEALGKLMLPEFADYWMPLLLPVLDEFVESYKGRVNAGFWQSMVKLRNNGMANGSGGAEFISGWIQILFPYLAWGGLNEDLNLWQDKNFSGPETTHFPAIISSAPVDWDYYGDLHFHAGVTGFAQDSTDGTLTPVVGWYVTHDPPRTIGSLITKLKTEMADLLAGHKEEYEAAAIDESQPWYRRYSFLQGEHAKLRGSVAEEV